MTAWFRRLRKRLRIYHINQVRSECPEFAAMTMDQAEYWIYGDVLKTND